MLLSGAQRNSTWEGAGLQSMVNVATEQFSGKSEKSPRSSRVEALTLAGCCSVASSHLLAPSCHGAKPSLPPSPWEKQLRQWTSTMWRSPSHPLCSCSGGPALSKFSLQHYLGFLRTQHVHHHLHHCLVHAEDSHEVWVLVEHLVVHYVSRVRIRERLQHALISTL